MERFLKKITKLTSIAQKDKTKRNPVRTKQKEWGQKKEKII